MMAAALSPLAYNGEPIDIGETSALDLETMCRPPWFQALPIVLSERPIDIKSENHQARLTGAQLRSANWRAKHWDSDAA